MLFKQFAINGTIYEERDGYLFRLDSNVPTKILKVSFYEFIKFF